MVVKLKTWVVQLFLILLSVLITLLILEGLVRSFKPQQLILIRPDIWIPVEGVGWKMAPNVDTLINTGERDVWLITDQNGYRVGETLDAIANPANDFLETRSRLYQLFKNRTRFFLMRVGLSAYNFSEAVLSSESISHRWGVTAEICAKIDKLRKANGIPIVFVFLPAHYQIAPEIMTQYIHALDIDESVVDLEQPNRLLAAEFEHLGLTYIDVTSVLKDAHTRNVPDLYGDVDVHFGIMGHGLVAQALHQNILEILER